MYKMKQIMSIQTDPVFVQAKTFLRDERKSAYEEGKCFTSYISINAPAE